MSIVLLALGVLCILGYVVLGFLSAPNRLSPFGKFVWLRENTRGQKFRRVRFAFLISGFILLLSSAAAVQMSSHPQGLANWVRRVSDWVTPFDLVCAILMGAGGAAIYLFGGLAERWGELQGKAKSIALVATILKFLVVAPILSYVAIPVLFLIQKS